MQDASSRVSAFSDVIKFSWWMSPPPDLTFTRHWPQEPPPPQAEDTKIPAPVRHQVAWLPGWVTIAFSGSPFTEIVMSPDGTSLDLANRITSTRANTIMVNIATLRMNTRLGLLFLTGCLPYSWTPEKDIKPNAIRPTVMNVIPRPRPRYVRVLHLLHGYLQGKSNDSQHPTHTRTGSRKQQIQSCSHELPWKYSTTKDCTVNCDQWKEDTQCVCTKVGRKRSRTISRFVQVPR